MSLKIQNCWQVRRGLNGHNNYKNGWTDASDKCRERFETETAVSKKSIKTFLSNSRGDCRDYDPDTGYKNAGSTWKVRGLSDNMRNNVGCDSPTFIRCLILRNNLNI